MSEANEEGYVPDISETDPCERCGHERFSHEDSGRCREVLGEDPNGNVCELCDCKGWVEPSPEYGYDDVVEK